MTKHYFNDVDGQLATRVMRITFVGCSGLAVPYNFSSGRLYGSFSKSIRDAPCFYSLRGQHDLRPQAKEQVVN
ncbi:hypothetical protein FRC0493_02250 [Corynebacterium diphtheriae]|nr:hypothetical protein CIP107566_02296 [Corynebacterium diphtheriae]CAB1013064.1 hypothetical protein FRC0493_02250 [Corynebacterium diphtheriae]